MTLSNSLFRNTIYIYPIKLNYKYIEDFFVKLLNFLNLLIFSDAVEANFWRVIRNYRQGPGGRSEVSDITSPSLHSIPMKDIEICKNTGAKLLREFINLLGNLTINGLVYIAVFLNKIIFSHHEHNHHPCNYHFRKNYFLFQNIQLIKQKACLLWKVLQ